MTPFFAKIQTFLELRKKEYETFLKFRKVIKIPASAESVGKDFLPAFFEIPANNSYICGVQNTMLEMTENNPDNKTNAFKKNLAAVRNQKKSMK